MNWETLSKVAIAMSAFALLIDDDIRSGFWPVRAAIRRFAAYIVIGVWAGLKHGPESRSAFNRTESILVRRLSSYPLLKLKRFKAKLAFKLESRLPSWMSRSEILSRLERCSIRLRVRLKPARIGFTATGPGTIFSSLNNTWQHEHNAHAVSARFRDSLDLFHSSEYTFATERLKVSWVTSEVA